jgi:hypothetical protein
MIPKELSFDVQIPSTVTFPWTLPDFSHSELLLRSHAHTAFGQRSAQGKLIHHIQLWRHSVELPRLCKLSYYIYYVVVLKRQNQEQQPSLRAGEAEESS